ncbi:MAG TPA: hypothetical protein P5069_18050, partial [Candidatus Hydrogenedentes bacterium]|nr:hypothetical protein [Candidatus Hydrogenedentota bacterium]
MLCDAPGLDATGVIGSQTADLDETCAAEVDVVEGERETPNPPGEDADKAGKEHIAEAVKAAHEGFEGARAFRRSPLARFPRLPIVAACEVSGLGASGTDRVGDQDVLVSKPVLAKRKAAGRATERMEELHAGLPVVPFKNLDTMEKKTEGLEWIAVIHADGNGLGQLFLDFHNYVGTGQTGEKYKEAYGAFSKALDEVCQEAYRVAVRETFQAEAAKGSPEEPEQIPIIPIVVAGDDLTVIMDGKKALRFTEAFMRAFCAGTSCDGGAGKEETEDRKLLRKLCGKLEGNGQRLGMAAGVCICKPHFPFSTAYTLAEELMRSAKQVKQKASLASSALDFHILYDTTATSVEDIRGKLAA